MRSQLRWLMVSVALLLLPFACTTTPEVVSQPASPSPSAASPLVTPSPAVEKPERVKLPDLTSQHVAAARARLRAKGFKVAVKDRFDQFAITYALGIVTAQRPGPGETRPGRKITLFVNPACTPGYSPCLPPYSDYDCAGGTGDGPKYTGFHYVTGYDPYGLDGNDNDGRGCE